MASAMVTEQENTLDGIGNPVLVFQPGTDMSEVFAGIQTQQLTQLVRTSAALGWSLAELLGRCYQLKDEAVPVRDDVWNGAKLKALPEVHTAREKIRSLMEHIVFLAGILDVGSQKIEHEGDAQDGRAYEVVLMELIKKLCSVRFDDGETHQSVVGAINERLYFWDLKIHDALQDQHSVVHKAYMVGRTLSKLRWYFGMLESILDRKTLDDVCDQYVPFMAPYLYPFTPGALQSSIRPWGEAILNGEVKPGPDGYAPMELAQQAHIWYGLITGGLNPLSFVDPSTEGRRYLWRMLRVAWPLLLISLVALVVIVAVVVIALVVYKDQLVAGVTAVAGALAIAGTSHSATTNVGSLLRGAPAQPGGAAKFSLAESVWRSTQQKAINEEVFIVPAGMISK